LFLLCFSTLLDYYTGLKNSRCSKSANAKILALAEYFGKSWFPGYF
jgi:hypothetical protein